MKKYLLLFLMLLGCVANSYSQQKKEQNDILTLKVKSLGWQKEEGDGLDTAKYIALKVVIKNVSADTVKYGVWIGDPEAIFQINNPECKFKLKKGFDRHYPSTVQLTPNATEECLLYITPPNKKSIHKKLKLGMYLILPSPTKRLDWDFLEREPYAVVWSNEITLNN